MTLFIIKKHSIVLLIITAITLVIIRQKKQNFQLKKVRFIPKHNCFLEIEAEMDKENEETTTQNQEYFSVDDKFKFNQHSNVFFDRSDKRSDQLSTK